MAGEPLRFPAGFVFGVATAAYQVEGHIDNDWTDWERAGRLKDPKARGCGKSVDHWNRFEEDLRLLEQLGGRAFRVSIEWSRVEPSPGHFDEAALEAYRARFLRMKERGVLPVVTLLHYTHPRWFHQETPWESPESLVAWRRFVERCARILEGTGAMVVTLNEPMVFLLGGFVSGVIPPGHKDGARALAALANIARAHALGRLLVRERCPDSQVGISQNMLLFAPDRFWHPIDRALTRLADYNYNHSFLEALTTGTLRTTMPGMSGKAQIENGRDSMDYLGINYYSRAHMRFLWKPPFVEYVYRDRHRRGLTHIGWEVYPEGFRILLHEVRRYGRPIWVTENGIDDRTGESRTAWLHSHWSALLSAAAEGADVRGYLYWSLMDNFEWLEGWGPRFGLYRVDFDSLERTPTPTVPFFREVATTGVLPAAP